LLERTRHPLDRLMKGRLLNRYRHMEAAALARANLVVATTARDREVFASMLPERVETIVIPTGLDTDYFVPQAGIEPEPNHIVFYGALSNPMNRDAARFLVDDILPRLRIQVPGVRLTILGAFPQPEHYEMARRDPGIHLTGYVEDVRGPLSRAAVVVCPLRFGYGIRGRIFELLSMNVPVVATPVAVAGMGLADGEGMLLAEGAEAFAAAVAGLLGNPQRRAALAQRGREIAVRRMSIAATYDALVAELARRTGAGAPTPAGDGM
jgi:glycosyltransferase involved in cell wall biosynthesis